MYLEIDEGYFEHPKTLALCAALNENHAAIYPIRLWKWACRSARDGRLGRVGAFVVEKVVGYEPMDGKCFAAMCCGFIDVGPDGIAAIHDWMTFTGGAIKRMEDKASANRKRREEGKRRYDADKAEHEGGTVPESYQHRTGINPSQTSPDQTSPDQSRGDPPARVAKTEPIRPRTGQDFLTCLKVAVEKHQPQAGMWHGGPFGARDADELLRGFGDAAKATPEIERKIALFAADPDMQPWTVKKFCEKYNGIGLPKLDYGKAPKKSEVPRQTPVIE